ncbi:MAG TPA: ABC transporter permease [Steroidobacteraceae bacterium]
MQRALAPRRYAIDRLGALLSLVGGAALLLLPLVVFKMNRIVPGTARPLLQIFSAWAVFGFYATLLLVALIALIGASARVRLIAALVGIAVLIGTIGIAGDALTPAGNQVVRISPGAAFWILLLCLGLLTTDAITRLRPGPGLRVLFLVLFAVAAAVTLASGLLDHLSIMREYQVNAGVFAREARQHVLLALGSVSAAVLVAVPAGILCHRVARLRAGVLGTLNLIQTIPSIALFGILMVPLGALATAAPAVTTIGIRGIGAAPAVLALFLYSLLPVVANTIVGLGRVPRATVDAARGMGLTSWQILTDVELILAFPVILTGIRIVLVQNIGLVTVAALIGAGGFGTFVFQGISQTAMDLVLLGALPIVALAFSSAVLLDALVEALSRPAQ